MKSGDVEQARRWAEFYRMRGFDPLPSRPDAKRPWCRFADYWEAPAPADLFDRFTTTNIQLICGRRTRLLVVDLDGEAARERWGVMGPTPRTWITHSGGDGHHVWFRLPAGLERPIGKAELWRADPSKPRQKGDPAIERLCDQSLVMAPPSIHPTTGRRYRFLDRAHSPARLPLPADCPAWVLRLRPVAPMVSIHRPAPDVATRRHIIPSSRPFDRNAVLEAIPDKIALAKTWGVRIAGRPSPKGWVPVQAIDREDNHPSAAIHQESGSYVDLGSGLRLSLFDLGVTLGIYRDWREAANDLGAKYA